LSHVKLLGPAGTNPQWDCVVGYGPFFLCVIHKEDLCPSNGGINRLMMMMNWVPNPSIINTACTVW
jgi:hypothetical protein